MRLITDTGGLIQTNLTGEITGGGVALGALLSGGIYRQIDVEPCFANDDSDPRVMAIGLKLIDADWALLLNFVVLEAENGQDFTWGVSLNPTYSGVDVTPTFSAVPGSTAVEYALGGATLGTTAQFSDRGIDLFHSRYQNSSTGDDVIDAESISGIQAGTGYTIKGTIDELAIWINSHGNNGTYNVGLSFVELDLTT